MLVNSETQIEIVSCRLALLSVLHTVGQCRKRSFPRVPIRSNRQDALKMCHEGRRANATVALYQHTSSCFAVCNCVSNKTSPAGYPLGSSLVTKAASFRLRIKCQHSDCHDMQSPDGLGRTRQQISSCFVKRVTPTFALSL